MRKARADLAGWIKLRDENRAAVAALEVQERKHEEKVGGLRHGAYVASEALEELRREIDEARARCMGDQQAVVRFFIREGRGAPDALLEEAKSVADEADRVRTLAYDELEIVRAGRANAEAELRWSQGKVEVAARALMLEAHRPLFEQATAAAAEAARLRYALGFVLAPINLDHRDVNDPKNPLNEIRNILQNPRWGERYEAEGTRPWEVAFKALQRDAEAPLPVSESAQQQAEAA